MRERSAVHLVEDYPLKGMDGDGGEKEKKDVLKRRMEGRMEGEIARAVRGHMNHMAIKCVCGRGLTEKTRMEGNV